MSNFESALRELARRKLTGIKIDAAGPQTYNGFIRVGVTVNRDAINKIFAEMGYQTLRSKYEVLERFAKYLAWLSPVYTGYFVKNWQVNPRSRTPTTNVSEEPSPIGAYISSGAFRRKAELSSGQKDSARQETEERLTATLQEKFYMYEGTNTVALKDTWAFYNPTPYADAVESKHGVIAGAAAAVGL